MMLLYTKTLHKSDSIDFISNREKANKRNLFRNPRYEKMIRVWSIELPEAMPGLIYYDYLLVNLLSYLEEAQEWILYTIVIRVTTVT